MHQCLYEAVRCTELVGESTSDVTVTSKPQIRYHCSSLLYTILSTHFYARCIPDNPISLMCLAKPSQASVWCASVCGEAAISKTRLHS